MHSNSDSQPNGLPDSDATVPLSPAPSGSDVIPNHVLPEREIALQNLQQNSDSNEYATDGLKEGTISYEVALERELEHQKRVKNAFLQPSATTRLPPMPSQVRNPLIFINS